MFALRILRHTTKQGKGYCGLDIFVPINRGSDAFDDLTIH